MASVQETRCFNVCIKALSLRPTKSPVKSELFPSDFALIGKGICMHHSFFWILAEAMFFILFSCADIYYASFLFAVLDGNLVNI